jgi:hypothetical protein
MNISITPKDINKRNSEFWLAQSQLLHQRMSIPGVAEAATYIVGSDAARGVPIRWQKPFEQVVAEETMTREICLREQARKAGRARQADALQQLIRKFVNEKPKLSEPLLIHLLAGDRGAGVVISIDGPSGGLAGVREIHWVDNKQRPRATPVSGLKDRLRRAKKDALTS